MIRKAALVLFILSFYVHPALAQKRELGAGVAAGDPFGLTGKYWLDDKQAIDLSAAWRLGDSDSFQLHSDFLYHMSLANIQGRSLPFYVGVGPRFTFDDEDHDGDTSFGPRFPVGLSYMFPQDPVELFGEIAPGMDIAPDTDFDLQWGLGFRFYFK